MTGNNDFHRRQFLNTGLAAASYGLCTSSLLPHLAGAQQPQQASAEDELGERELLVGLDGMSRAAIEGRNAFADGHSAAAVMASAFFAREQNLVIEVNGRQR